MDLHHLVPQPLKKASFNCGWLGLNLGSSGMWMQYYWVGAPELLCLHAARSRYFRDRTEKEKIERRQSNDTDSSLITKLTCYFTRAAFCSRRSIDSRGLQRPRRSFNWTPYAVSREIDPRQICVLGHTQKALPHFLYALLVARQNSRDGIY